MPRQQEDRSTSAIVKMFLFRPWEFWTMLLSTSKLGSLTGTIIISTVLSILYNFLPKGYTWWGIGLFLVWVGPILVVLPFLFLVFVLPILLYGEDWDVPVGCGRNKETGKLDCI